MYLLQNCKMYSIILSGDLTVYNSRWIVLCWLSVSQTKKMYSKQLLLTYDCKCSYSGHADTEQAYSELDLNLKGL